MKIKLLKDCIFTGFEESISEANFKHFLNRVQKVILSHIFQFVFYSYAEHERPVDRLEIK